MRGWIVAIFALLGAGFSAWLSDRCILSEERSISLFAPVCCAACGRRREIWDRVPLLSWLLNGGKCRFCGAIMSGREPLITFCTVTVWMLGLRLWLPEGQAYALIRAVTGSALLCAAGLCWIGASEKPVLLPILICTGVSGILLPDGISLGSHAIGAAGLFAFGMLMRLLPKRFRGPDRLRLDTILYLGITGLLLGWRGCFSILPAAVMMRFLFALCRRKRETSPNAGKVKEPVYADPTQGHFTSSLCLTGAAVLALAFGRPLMDWYIGIFAQIG